MKKYRINGYIYDENEVGKAASKRKMSVSQYLQTVNAVFVGDVQQQTQPTVQKPKPQQQQQQAQTTTSAKKQSEPVSPYSASARLSNFFQTGKDLDVNARTRERESFPTSKNPATQQKVLGNSVGSFIEERATPARKEVGEAFAKQDRINQERANNPIVLKLSKGDWKGAKEAIAISTPEQIKDAKNKYSEAIEKNYGNDYGIKMPDGQEVEASEISKVFFGNDKNLVKTSDNLKAKLDASALGKANKLITDAENGVLSSEADAQYLGQIAPKATSELKANLGGTDTDDLTELSKKQIEKRAAANKEVVDNFKANFTAKYKIDPSQLSTPDQINEVLKTVDELKKGELTQYKDDGILGFGTSPIIEGLWSGLKSVGGLMDDFSSYATEKIYGIKPQTDEEKLARLKEFNGEKNDAIKNYERELENNIGVKNVNQKYASVRKDIARGMAIQKLSAVTNSDDAEKVKADIEEKYWKIVDPEKGINIMKVRAGGEKSSSLDQSMKQFDEDYLFALGQSGNVAIQSFINKETKALDYKYPSQKNQDVLAKLGAELEKEWDNRQMIAENSGSPLVGVERFIAGNDYDIAKLDKIANTQFTDDDRNFYYEKTRDEITKSIGYKMGGFGRIFGMNIVPNKGIAPSLGGSMVMMGKAVANAVGGATGIRTQSDYAADALEKDVEKAKDSGIGKYSAFEQRLNELKQIPASELSTYDLNEIKKLEEYGNLRNGLASFAEDAVGVVGQVKSIGLIARPIQSLLKGVGMASEVQTAAKLASTEGTMARMAVKLGNADAVGLNIAGGLVSYDEARVEAQKLFAGDPLKIALHTAIVTGGNIASEHMYKDTKFMQQFNSEIANFVQNATIENLTRESLQNGIRGAMDKAIKLGGYVLKDTESEAREEFAVSVATSASKLLLGAKNYGINDAANDALHTYTQTFVDGSLVGLISGAKSYKDSRVGINLVARAGQDPTYRADVMGAINKAFDAKEITEEQKNERLKVLNTIADTYQTSISSISKSGLDLDQNTLNKLALIITNKKIINAKIKEGGSDAVVKAYEVQLKELDQLESKLISKEYFFDKDYVLRNTEEERRKVEEKDAEYAVVITDDKTGKSVTTELDAEGKPIVEKQAPENVTEVNPNPNEQEQNIEVQNTESTATTQQQKELEAKNQEIDANIVKAENELVVLEKQLEGTQRAVARQIRQKEITAKKAEIKSLKASKGVVVETPIENTQQQQIDELEKKRKEELKSSAVLLPELPPLPFLEGYEQAKAEFDKKVEANKAAVNERYDAQIEALKQSNVPSQETKAETTTQAQEANVLAPETPQVEAVVENTQAVRTIAEIDAEITQVEDSITEDSTDEETMAAMKKAKALREQRQSAVNDISKPFDEQIKKLEATNREYAKEKPEGKFVEIVKAKVEANKQKIKELKDQKKQAIEQQAQAKNATEVAPKAEAPTSDKQIEANVQPISPSGENGKVEQQPTTSNQSESNPELKGAEITAKEPIRNWKVQGRTISNSIVGGKISESDSKEIIKQIVNHPLNKYDNLQLNYNKDTGTISFFGDKDLVNIINEDIGNKSLQKIKMQQEADAINKAKVEKEKVQLEYINSKKTESEWIDKTFGEGFIGNANKIELIKYISGESSKFSGILNRQMEEGLNKIGAIKDGNVDFKQIKKAFSESLLSKEQPTTQEQDTTPNQSETPQSEVTNTDNVVEEKQASKEKDKTSKKDGKKSNTKTTRVKKAKPIVEAIESEAEVVANIKDAERATELLETIERTTELVRGEGDVDSSFEENHGVSASEIANELNNLGKDGDLTQAYENVVGKKIEDYFSFVSEFLSELSSLGITLKNKVYVDIKKLQEDGNDIIINVEIKKGKAAKEGGIESLSSIVGKDEFRPAQKGVFIDNGTMVATDGHRLVILPIKEKVESILKKVRDAYEKSLAKIIKIKSDRDNAIKERFDDKVKDGIDGKLFDVVGGGIINEKFPAYKQVLPIQNDFTDLIPIQELIDIANSSVNALKNINKSNPTAIMIKVGDAIGGFNPKYVLEILQAIQSSGAKQVKLAKQEGVKGLYIEADNGAIAMVMPIMTDGTPKTQIFEYPLAKNVTEKKDTTPTDTPLPFAVEGNKKQFNNGDNFVSSPKVNIDEEGNIILERLRPEEEQGRNKSGGINAEATIVLAGLHRATKQNYGENSKEYIGIKQNEEKYLEDFAKNNDIWIEDDDKKLGTFLKNGQEQKVYIDAKNTSVVNKTNDLSMHEHWLQLLDRIAIHNANFPSTAYTLKGFGRDSEGTFVAVLEQPYIQAESLLSQQEVVDYMKGRGFELLSKYDESIKDTQEEFKSFINRNSGIIVSDLHLNNVRKDDNGNIYVIDPIIELDSEEKGYDGTRVAELPDLDYNESQENTTQEAVGQETTTPNQVSQAKLIMQYFQDGIKKQLFAPFEEFASKLKELGYDNVQFLKTPKGIVLGFVAKDANGNEKIYLNPNSITPETSLHELSHLQQAMIRIASNQGDKDAQAVLRRWERLINDAKVMEQMGKGDKTENPLQAQIIGELGAENLPKVKENLQIARDMEAAGKTPKEIYLATGWERSKDRGKWKYDLPDIKNINKIAFNKAKTEKVSLYELIGDNIIFDAYPELKDLKIKRGKESFYNALDKTLTLADVFTYLSAKSTLIHEIQHAVQHIEGFRYGTTGSMEMMVAKSIYSDLLSKKIYKENKEYRDLYDKSSELPYYISDTSLEKNKERELMDDRLQEIYDEYLKQNPISEDKIKAKAEYLYLSNKGEVEARNAQKRAQMTSIQRKGKMLSETEDVVDESKKYLYSAKGNSSRIIKIGDLSIDLSSDVYNQGVNESDSDYKDRILNEVWAYAVAPEALKQFEAASNKSKLGLQLWNFIQSVGNYFKNKLGIKGNKNIQSMTFKELVKASATSLLKKEYFDLIDKQKREVSELESIKSKAIADGTFMKAPNGKSSNLNEKQWLQVRSKAFTSWFGDWQNDPQNASKVVDENGEPLVVYRAEYTGENILSSYKQIGVHLVDNRDVAEDYNKSNAKLFAMDNAIDLDAMRLLLPTNLDDLDSFLKNPEKLNEFIEKSKSPKSTSKVIDTFVNVRKPTIIDNTFIKKYTEYIESLLSKDEKGKDEILNNLIAWHEKYGRNNPFKLLVENNTLDEIIDVYLSGNLFNFGNKLKGSDISKFGFIEMENFYPIFKDFVNSNNSDGILRKHDAYNTIGLADNEIIAFSPNQIKLADGTNTTFNPNTNDIRFSVSQKLDTTIDLLRSNPNYNLEGKTTDQIEKDLGVTPEQSEKIKGISDDIEAIKGTTMTADEVNKLFEEDTENDYSQDEVDYILESVGLKEKKQEQSNNQGSNSNTSDTRKSKLRKTSQGTYYSFLESINETPDYATAVEKSLKEATNPTFSQTQATSDNVLGRLESDYIIEGATLTELQAQADIDEQVIKEQVEALQAQDESIKDLDWVDIFLDASLETREEKGDTTMGNNIRVIGILNNIAAKLNAIPYGDRTFEEQQKYIIQVAKIERLTNTISRQGSLILNARKNFRQMHNLIQKMGADSISNSIVLSEKDAQLVDDYAKAVTDAFTDAELNKESSTLDTEEQEQEKPKKSSSKKKKPSKALLSILSGAKKPQDQTIVDINKINCK